MEGDGRTSFSTRLPVRRAESRRLEPPLPMKVAYRRGSASDANGRPLVDVCWSPSTCMSASTPRRVQAVVVATGRRTDGHREVLGVDVGDSQNEALWREFLTGPSSAPLVASPGDLRRPCRVDQGDRRCSQGVASQRAEIRLRVLAARWADRKRLGRCVAPRDPQFARVVVVVGRGSSPTSTTWPQLMASRRS